MEDLLKDGRIVRRFKAYDTNDMAGPRLMASKPDGGEYRTDDPVLLERFIAKKDEADNPLDDTPMTDWPQPATAQDMSYDASTGKDSPTSPGGEPVGPADPEGEGQPVASSRVGARLEV